MIVAIIIASAVIDYAIICRAYDNKIETLMDAAKVAVVAVVVACALTAVMMYLWM